MCEFKCKDNENCTANISRLVARVNCVNCVCRVYMKYSLVYNKLQNTKTQLTNAGNSQPN